MLWNVYKRRKRWIWFLVFLVVLGYLSTWWMQRMDEVLLAYLEILEQRQLKQDVTEVLQGVVDGISYDTENMMVIQTGDDGYISSISYDSRYLQQILSQVIDQAKAELQEVSEFTYEIKMGMFTQNIYLAETGPALQLTLKSEPYLEAKLNISMEPYGINNTMLYIGVDVNVYLYTVSPVIKKAVMITCYVPLVIQMVTGKTPIGYPYAFE